MYRKPLDITRLLFWALDGENKYQHGFREEAYDYTIDWWAFGVLVYELLTNSSLWYLCAEDAEVNTVKLWRHIDVIMTLSYYVIIWFKGRLDHDALKDETLEFTIDRLGRKVSDISKSLLEGLLTQVNGSLLCVTFYLFRGWNPWICNPLYWLNLTKDPSDRLAETCSGRKPRTAIVDLKSHEFFQGMILLTALWCYYYVIVT